MKENPESWLNARLSDIDPSEAKIIADGKIVNQAASEIGNEWMIASYVNLQKRS